MSNENKNRFDTGEIVYWCHSYGNGIYSVKYGMVDEQYSDAVIVDYLTPRDRRLINGIPINEFESEEKRKKLPKGWTYNTPLYSLTYSDLTSKEIDIVSYHYLQKVIMFQITNCIFTMKMVLILFMK